MADTSKLSEDDLVALALARDFEIDELIKEGFLSNDEQRTAPLDQELIFDYDELSLHVTAGPCYPAVAVAWRIDNRTLSRKAVDELRSQLRAIVEASTETNNIPRWKSQEDAFGIFEPSMVVLELGRETIKHLKLWRDKMASMKVQKKTEDSEWELPFQEKPASSIMTTSDVAYHFLQQSPQKICEKIPSEYRILHVEEVLRVDLAYAFQRKQDQMREKLHTKSISALRASIPPNLQHSKRMSVLVDYLVQPRITFHGTSRQFVPSIVRHGFLKPGSKNSSTGKEHEVRCGATYGQGIYSSPDPEFSLSYSGYLCHATKPNEFFGIKLLVCATIMGRTASMGREDNWRSKSEPYPGADSHVANRGLEYIVFDTHQIIPIYVVHIDWGRDNADHFADLPSDPVNFVPSQQKKTAAEARSWKSISWPGEKKRAKAAIFASASKWFPYGYGPASGTKFVVEEVGEVDEDEEEYGDYQALRGEEIHDKSKLDFWSWVKVGEEMDAAASSEGNAEGRVASADEYTAHRKGYRIAASDTTSSWDGMPVWDAIPVPREDSHTSKEKDEDEDFGLGQLML
ncbi:ADP-ribosylation [Whalleya microplaca]|nr:ADP-ribosylation [Whalleya microplaca]